MASLLATHGTYPSGSSGNVTITLNDYHLISEAGQQPALARYSVLNTGFLELLARNGVVTPHYGPNTNKWRSDADPIVTSEDYRVRATLVTQSGSFSGTLNQWLTIPQSFSVNRALNSNGTNYVSLQIEIAAANDLTTILESATIQLEASAEGAGGGIV